MVGWDAGSRQGPDGRWCRAGRQAPEAGRPPAIQPIVSFGISLRGRGHHRARGPHRAHWAPLCNAPAVEPWLVAIASFVALVVVSGLLLRGRGETTRVRAVAGAAPGSDPVAAVAALRTQNDQLEAALASDRRDHDLLLE